MSNNMSAPIFVPSGIIDNSENYFYITFNANSATTQENFFTRYRMSITNLSHKNSDGTMGKKILNFTSTPISDRTTPVTGFIERAYPSYFEKVYGENGTLTISYGLYTYDKWLQHNEYHIGFPKEYSVDNKRIFENGNKYSIQIRFFTDSTYTEYVDTEVFIIQCYSNFTISLESYQYNDGEPHIVADRTDITLPYELNITKSFCKLNFAYTQDDGEQLKYYQFSLYNNDGVLLGMSKKIYGIPNAGIVYGIENYNNLQNYILKLYCVTQTNRNSVTTVNIHTNYVQDDIYADITFLVDTQTATNNVSASVIQLNGEGEGYSYDSVDNGECYVVIPDSGYVTFKDEYQVITNNFLCRMWLKNLSKNIPILTIDTSDNSGRVEVFFDGMNFIAKKYSCDLVAPYMTCIKDTSETDITSEVSANKDIYFAIGYYNGRIEMYARIIS